MAKNRELSPSEAAESDPKVQIRDKDMIWMKSKDVMKLLRLSSCELMHERISGTIPFRKKGNQYEYLVHLK